MSSKILLYISTLAHKMLESIGERFFPSVHPNSTQGNPRFVKTKKGKIWDYFRTMHNKRAAGPILICKCSREFCCCAAYLYNFTSYFHHTQISTLIFWKRYSFLFVSGGSKFWARQRNCPVIWVRKIPRILNRETISDDESIHTIIIHMWPTTPEQLRIGISFHFRLRGSSLLFYDYYSPDQQGFFS